MKKLISLVLPVYNEAENIGLLYKDIRKVFDPLQKRYNTELIFVNDGSTDNSSTILANLAAGVQNVHVINLSRNFGHQIAITAGLDFAKGDAVITLDSDMQDPPIVCPKLIRKWEAGYEVVYAEHRKRNGESLFKRVSAKWFYKIINFLSETDIPQNVGDFRLLDRQVLDQLKRFGEHQRFVRGLVGYVGFNQTSVLFDRPARQNGKTNYSLTKMWRLASDGMMGFSTVPLKIISRLGYVIAFVSMLTIAYTVWVKLFVPERTVEGWAFVTVSIFFIGGVQLIMLGLIGSYIARTYTEAQNRPLYIVSSIISKKSKIKKSNI